MIQILAILNGILITTMIMMNGELAANMGNYHATVFIHLSGLVLITIFYLIKRKNLTKSKERLPLYLYSGGAIGVLTVVFNNVSTIHLGVTITLGISLLAQSITSLIIDHYGFFNIQRHKFNKHKLIGLFCIILGIFAMFL